ncbi:hypothetical protein B0H16DRAFT_1859645, partial [Mycena metata]
AIPLSLPPSSPWVLSARARAQHQDHLFPPYALADLRTSGPRQGFTCPLQAWPILVDLKVLNSRIRHDKVLGVSTVPSPTPGDARTYDLYPRIHSPATPQLFNSLPVKSHRTLRNLDCAPSPHTKPFQEAAWSHQIHSVYPSIFQVVKSAQGLNSEKICVLPTLQTNSSLCLRSRDIILQTIFNLRFRDNLVLLKYFVDLCPLPHPSVSCEV